MPPITITLTGKQACDLRHHLCVAYNHWAQEARKSSEGGDRLVCERIATNALDLFSLCLAADHTLEEHA